MFSYVLEAFAACGTVDEIVVVCKDSSRFEPLLGGVSVVFAPGGATRAASVYNGVRAADAKTKFVCIHDCARPFITPEDIRLVCEKAYETGAAAACSPMRDTVKYIEPEKKVLFTPAREHLIAVATPQVFRREVYLAACAAARSLFSRAVRLAAANHMTSSMSIYKNESSPLLRSSRAGRKNSRNVSAP